MKTKKIYAKITKYYKIILNKNIEKNFKIYRITKIFIFLQNEKKNMCCSTNYYFSQLFSLHTQPHSSLHIQN